LDLQVASETAAEGDLKESPQLKFQLGGEQRGDSEVGKGLGVGGGSTYLQQQREERPIVASLQGVIQTSGIPARLPTSTHAGQSSLTAIQQQGAVIQISEPAAVSDSTTATLGDNMLKIQYKEYDQKILSAEMRPLMSHAELCDTVLVCRDGRLLTSSLVLAGLSSLLRTALDSVPRIDAYKMVIMPEEITISQVLLLNKIIFDESTTGSGSLLDLSPEQLNHVRTVSQVLGCEDILSSPSSKNPMNSTSSGTPPPSRGIKRPAPIGNPARRRPAKTSRGTGAATTSLSSSSVKLEKN